MIEAVSAMTVDDERDAVGAAGCMPRDYVVPLEPLDLDVRPSVGEFAWVSRVSSSSSTPGEGAGEAVRGAEGRVDRSSSSSPRALSRSHGSLLGPRSGRQRQEARRLCWRSLVLLV